MANHRYWRVRGSGTQDGGVNMALSRVEMRATAGGADQCTGGTPICSSQFNATTTAPGYNVVCAYDGNAATAWASANSSQGVYWVGYDFGTPVDVQEILIATRNDASFGQGPSGIFIEYSDDNITWTTVRQHIGYAAWTIGSNKVFANVALAAPPAVYWRVRGLSVQDANIYLGLAEVEMRATVGGADQCAGGTVLYSSQFDATVGGVGHAGVNAFDNNTATKWANAATTPVNTGCAWIGYQFAAAVSVLEISLNARNDVNYTQAPMGFTLDFSHDGLDWEVVRAWYPGLWAQNLLRAFAVAASDVMVSKATIQVGSVPALASIAVTKATLQLGSVSIPGVRVSKATLQVGSNGEPTVRVTKATLQVGSYGPPVLDDQTSSSILW